MNPFLEHMARRVADAPDFLACALAEFARSEKLEDNNLATRLGCTLENLTHLRLCRMPRSEPGLFWQDVEQIAGRYSADAEILAEVVRRGQSLFHLRNAVSDMARKPNLLLAARDDDRESKPPEGAGS
jgi:hypothetical protein